MPNIDETIEDLKKVWNAFNGMEHELYADYVFDALVLLQEYKKHLINDLENMNNKILQAENEINTLTQINTQKSALDVR